MIELRSDTFTLPTAEMLSAIVGAQLGDDQYGEDPTVIKLERQAADALGKEEACLMPSGTMANLSSIMSHCCQSGAAALVGDRSDIYVYEDRYVAERAGIIYRPLHTLPDGSLSLSDIESELRSAAGASSRIALLCLENPHNLCGGVVLPLDYMRRIADFVHARGIKLHLDGARLFNAAIKLNISPAEIVKEADSVQFCLSKGLSAPIGSILAGNSDFIQLARRKRKLLGGDMRQAGIIAAAGIVSLERMVDRLQEDHVHARRLAEGLASMPGIEVDLSMVQTNTVVFRVVDKRFDSNSFIQTAWSHGLRISDFKYGRLRAVTHYGISEQDIIEALQIVEMMLEEGPAAEIGEAGIHISK